MRSLLIQAFAVGGVLGAALPSDEEGAPARKIVRRSGDIWATPHEQYSSSVGVLGCKINPDRVAYWPGSVGCDNICVKVTHEGRSVHLLRIDTSEGAYDMSYDAWNYLCTGEGAREQPTTGGPVPMQYEEVDPEECSDLIQTDDGKLPLSAANSMNYLASCLGEPGSWVAKNYRLYNVLDPICSLGYDEKCDLDWPAANQASCPNQLGVPNPLKGCPVYNVQYATGKTVMAGTNEVVDVASDAPAKVAPSSIQFSYSSTKAATPPPPAKSPEYKAESGDDYEEKEKKEPVTTAAPASPYPNGDKAEPEPPVETPAAYPSAAVFYSPPGSDGQGSGADSSSSYSSPSSTPATVPDSPNRSAGSDSSSSGVDSTVEGLPKTADTASAHTIYIPVSILVPVLVTFLMG